MREVSPAAAIRYKRDVSSWLQWLGYAAVALVGLAALGFALTAALEREWRAVGVSLVGGTLAAGAVGLPLWVAFPGRSWMLLGLLGLGALVALVALLPAAGGGASAWWVSRAGWTSEMRCFTASTASSPVCRSTTPTTRIVRSF